MWFAVCSEEIQRGRTVERCSYHGGPARARCMRFRIAVILLTVRAIGTGETPVIRDMF